MPSITRRYMKDRSRPNPIRNPIKEGSAICQMHDDLAEFAEKIKRARAEGPIVDHLRRLCAGCSYFNEEYAECNVHQKKCPKGLLKH